jgi:hypothetical protein
VADPESSSAAASRKISREEKQLRESTLDGTYWTGESKRPRSRRSQSQHPPSSSTGLFAKFSSGLSHFVPHAPPGFQNYHTTPEPSSIPGGWYPTPKQPTPGPAQIMPPKPEVKKDPVVTTDTADPAWVATLLKRMDVFDDKLTKLTPRIAAIEDEMTNQRADSSDDESQRRSSRGRSKGKARQRRRSRSESSSRDRRRNRSYDKSRHRRRDRSHDDEDEYTDRRPRLRTDSLPKVCYSSDVAIWLLEMDQIVQKHGAEVVCPEIFAHCFQAGDAIKMWYMGLEPDFRTLYTSGPDCWKRFRSAMERRFTADVSMRQLAAEDRTRLSDETYAEFAIKKIALIRTAFTHLEEGAMIAMVKRKLDFDAARFCREKKSVEAFVSELVDYDNLRAMQPGRRQLQATRSTHRTYDQPQTYNQHPTYNQPYAPADVRDSGPSRRQSSWQPSSNPPAPSGATSFVDPRLPTVQTRKHPHTGVDTLSYLDRFGKAVFIQRPCGHCVAVGKPNAWHFEFSCSNKPTMPKRAKTYAMTDHDLPGTFESPSGLPTSYTFSGHAIDPGPEENPFCIDDVEDESGNGEWGQ